MVKAIPTLSESGWAVWKDAQDDGGTTGIREWHSSIRYLIFSFYIACPGVNWKRSKGATVSTQD
ncbi:MAG: hypothetical protein ACOX5R_04840 [bacterium]